MLKPLAYTYYTAPALQPKGWLLTQLRLQAEGLAGQLDKVWPDVRDSAWIGGTCEGWERVPYWLDGFIPLAYLLRDEDMITRAKRYIDEIIARQEEDGWLCPCTRAQRGGYDTWATLLITKVLALYADCPGDEGVDPAVYKALKNLKDHLTHHTLFNWGAARWFEGLVALFWLYDRRPEEWMLHLATTLRVQGLDWGALFDNWRDQENRRGEWTYQTHIVNLAMMLKYPALWGRVTGEDGSAKAAELLEKLHTCHGNVNGYFNGDECLAGTAANRGTELCGVTEAMYSYEHLFAATGDTQWLDKLELLAFNALPATISPDMWSHQYDQMTNQIACRKINRAHYNSNDEDANRFGLEPHYGCCTANMGQAWPKLALSAFAKAKDGILCVLPLPGVLSAKVNGTSVQVEVDTLYPFRDTAVYTVTAEEPTAFTLYIRVPKCASATLNDEPVTPGAIYAVKQVFAGKTTFTLQLTQQVEWITRPEELFALRRGPLTYSVPLGETWVKDEYEKNGVVRQFPYCDYDVLPKKDFGWAFAGEDFSLKENDIMDFPFSHEHPPVQLTATLRPIHWEEEPGVPGVCAAAPGDRTPTGEARTVALQPFGCTALRMTELPKL